MGEDELEQVRSAYMPHLRVRSLEMFPRWCRELRHDAGVDRVVHRGDLLGNVVELRVARAPPAQILLVVPPLAVRHGASPCTAH